MNYVEIYVPHHILETVVRAAAAYRDYGCNDDNLIPVINDAIGAIQESADSEFSPERLNVSPLV